SSGANVQLATAIPTAIPVAKKRAVDRGADICIKTFHRTSARRPEGLGQESRTLVRLDRAVGNATLVTTLTPTLTDGVSTRVAALRSDRGGRRARRDRSRRRARRRSTTRRRRRRRAPRWRSATPALDRCWTRRPGWRGCRPPRRRGRG